MSTRTILVNGSGGGTPYAIPYTLDFPVNGDISEAYDVNAFREGQMVTVSLSALSAPVSADLIVDPAFVDSAGAMIAILQTPLHLPVGQRAAVYANVFAGRIGLVLGDKLVNRVLQVGGAAHITTTIVVVRNN